jgi:CHAD domain-containing protein
MSFELDNQSNLRKQARKAATGHLDKALRALLPRSTSARSMDTSVHTARKRLKEVRALLRLLREGLGKKEFRRENKALRDAAHPLSEVRDAAAIVEALQSLQERYCGTVDKDTFKAVLRALRRRRTAIRQRILHDGKALTRSSIAVEKVRDRVGQWYLRGGAWQVLESGLERAYKQANQAMLEASRSATDENLHEWRKRAKDIRYQLELLEPLCPEVMKASAAQAETLTDLLGDDHDLAVLRSLLDGELKESVPLESAETLKGLIDARRGDIQHSAATLSEKLFAESPAQFVARIETYWKTAA